MKLACLFSTSNSIGPAILRLGLAAALFPHGAQKMLGWFGGHGFGGTMGFFTGTLHIPAFFAFLAMLTEFGAPIALFFGVFTRLAGLAIAVHITVAAILGGHIYNGFFMNWYGNQKGEGFEYHILMATIGLALVVLGAGCCALDRLIARALGGSASVAAPLSRGGDVDL
ncbi:MAG: DoxX family protein [Verrucomicrobiota bacterium]